MKSLRQLFLLACLCPLLAQAQAFSLPSFEQVRATHISSDALLLDRRGAPLADIRLNPDLRRLDWVPLSALSPAMRDALLRAEDRRFFQHSGVDWLAFAGAAWQNLWSGSKRGASTLTMQLAGLLDPALRMPPKRGERRSYTQKWDQSQAALALEAKWSKQQILEAYLNLAPFRGDLQGVGAASELLFGLPASQLSQSEASLLAALLRGPNAKPARVAQRACKLQATLNHTPLCRDITRLALTRLDAPRAAPRWALAPHLARALLKQPGQRLKTTLDADLQARLKAEMSKLDDPLAAAVLLDNRTGEVLAWLGAAQPSSPDGVSQRYTLPDWHWPVLAALAIDTRYYNAASPLPLASAIFDPRDARTHLNTTLSLRLALQAHHASALLYLHAQTPDATWHDKLQALGLGLPEPGSARHSAEPLSLLQLAALWRSFASGGNYQSPRLLPEAPPEAARRVWQTETAFILQDMLASGSPGAWSAHWLSAAQEDGSAILVGNNEHYTLALRSSRGDALARWQSMLNALGGESRAPVPPEGLVSALVRYEPPSEAPRREWFLRGTQIELLSALPLGQRGRIAFPRPASTYRVPAQIHQRQGWRFVADSSVAVHWLLDGKRLSEAIHNNWLPQPGHYRLSLTDPNDKLLDSIEFDVHAEHDQP